MPSYVMYCTGTQAYSSLCSILYCSKKYSTKTLFQLPPTVQVQYQEKKRGGERKKGKKKGGKGKEKREKKKKKVTICNYKLHSKL